MENISKSLIQFNNSLIKIWFSLNNHNNQQIIITNFNQLYNILIHIINKHNNPYQIKVIIKINTLLEMSLIILYLLMLFLFKDGGEIT
jgi:hypothetical protein